MVLFVTFALISLTTGTSLAAGDATGGMSGVVSNGTTSGTPVAGIPVTLHTFRNGLAQRDAQTQSDAVGRFRFDGLAMDSALQFLPVAQYQGVEYPGTAVALATNPKLSTEDNVSVYDTTSADPGLRLSSASLVLGRVDAAQQQLQFLELLTLENPANRTFVPSAPAQGMPTNLVRFALPVNATAVTVGDGLDASQIIQVDKGIASTAPVLPGQHTISFSYTVPYQAHSFSLAWKLVYPATVVHVLTSETGPAVTVRGFTSEDSLGIQGQTFRVLGGGPLAGNSSTAILITGLPGRTVLQAVEAALPKSGLPPYAALIAAGLSALIPAGYAMRRRRVAGTAVPSRESLLDQIAALDDTFGRGDLEETTYREQRARLKARLRAPRREQTVPPE